MNQKGENQAAEFLAEGEAYKAIFWPLQALRWEPFMALGSSQKGLSFLRPRYLPVWLYREKPAATEPNHPAFFFFVVSINCHNFIFPLSRVL